MTTAATRRRAWLVPVLASLAVLIAAATFVKLRSGAAENAPKPIALAPAPSSAPKSIAVLPLATVGREQRDVDLAVGLTSALTNAVTGIQGLRVASQTQAAAVRDSQSTITEIGRRLNVGMLVEGTLQRQREQLRVNLRVVSIDNDSTIWAGTFNGSANDTFRLQDSVTKAMVSALSSRVTTSTPAR